MLSHFTISNICPSLLANSIWPATFQRTFKHYCRVILPCIWIFCYPPLATNHRAIGVRYSHKVLPCYPHAIRIITLFIYKGEQGITPCYYPVSPFKERYRGWTDRTNVRGYFELPKLFSKIIVEILLITKSNPIESRVYIVNNLCEICWFD